MLKFFRSFYIPFTCTAKSAVWGYSDSSIVWHISYCAYVSHKMSYLESVYKQKTLAHWVLNILQGSHCLYGFFFHHQSMSSNPNTVIRTDKAIQFWFVKYYLIAYDKVKIIQYCFYRTRCLEDPTGIEWFLINGFLPDYNYTSCFNCYLNVM